VRHATEDANGRGKLEVKKALGWIDTHGNLVDAPFHDDEVAELFKFLWQNGWLCRRKGRIALTEAGIRKSIERAET
jgi:hypothetical protein